VNLKDPISGPRDRWKHTLKMNLKGTKYRDVDWIHQTEDGVEWHILVSMEMNIGLETRCGIF
jgi:hypothetical protein